MRSLRAWLRGTVLVAVAGSVGPLSALSADAGPLPVATAEASLARPMASMPDCDEDSVGDIWHDPDYNITFRCVCTYFEGDEDATCYWEPQSVGPRSTWTNYNSRYFLDVEGVSTDDGARLHQWSYTGAGNQWWTGTLNRDGTVRLVSENSKKCMGVLGGSQTQGAPVVQWTCDGTNNQSWAFAFNGSYVQDANGTWPTLRVMNKSSHLCLGVYGASMAVGAYVVQWTCNGHPDQIWY